MRIKKSKSILLILLAIITVLLVSFLINLTARNNGIISEKITSTIGRLEEEKVKMSVKIKERLGNGIVYVLVKIESQEEIESIVFPNEDGTSITITPQSERKTIAKDLKVELMKEYNVTINTKDGASVTKTILLEGDGTKEHPYAIKTKEELQAVNEDLSAYYVLGANIDLTGFKFTPIGNETPFTGNIDGTGYTISNLNLDSEESDNIGLFSNNNGTISNITLNDITVKGKSNVGGLVGYNSGIVTSCTVSGNVTGLGDNVGGLIGYVYAENKDITLSGNGAEGKVVGINQVGGLIGYSQIYATANGIYNLYIQKSYATVDVEGTSNVGGLIGYQIAHILKHNDATTANNYILQTYATGNVKATGDNVGGLVGYMYSYTALDSSWLPTIRAYVGIQNSFATGKVEGRSNIGGLVGYGYRQTNTTLSYLQSFIQIDNSYAIGEVIATGQVGGLVGDTGSTNMGSTIATNSYWVPETTKQEESVIGTKNLIPYMMRKLGYDDWDFENIWEIEELNTIAYLKDVPKPESVNKENIEYEEFDVIGEGTEESPFIITHPVQLQKITDRLSSYYKLGADIDLTGRSFKSIGTASSPFIGNIDGTGYTISNLSLSEEENSNMGLFGCNSGTIHNLTLTDSTITGNSNVGALVGYNAGVITECKVNASVIGKGDNVGGLIGYNIGTVTNNIVEGEVTSTGDNIGGLIGRTDIGISGNTSKVNVEGTNQTGGLIGYVYAGNRSITLSGNAAEGKVVGTNQVGGLIGYSQIYATANGTYNLYILQSYAIGDVEGISNVGGLIGYQIAHILKHNDTTIANNYILQSYATGDVKATGDNVGGLVGYMYSYTALDSSWLPTIRAYVGIQNSFATGKVEGRSNIGGLVGYGYRQNSAVKSFLQSFIQITNTYAIGEIVTTGQAGGLVGVVAASGSGSTTATDSYWNTETTKQEYSVLGTKSNTTNMTGTGIYTNWSSDVWTIEQGKYPKLKF